jgi:TatD family-associated radical SAM protein
MEDSDVLWLEHEPDLAEVKEAFAQYDVSDFDEIVFCGFGEPTERLDLLLQTAKYIKETYHKPIRINTNGQGDLINDRSIAPELSGLIDTVSISLNTPDAEKYQALVRSEFGDAAYPAMLRFAEEAKKYIPHVVMTTVATTLSSEEEEKCGKICKDLGVTYRIRPWED